MARRCLDFVPARARVEYSRADSRAVGWGDAVTMHVRGESLLDLVKSTVERNKDAAVRITVEANDPADDVVWTWYRGAWDWRSEVGALGVVFVATVEGVTPASKRTYRVARTRRGWEGDYLGMFGHIWEQWTTRAFDSPEAAMASVESTHAEYVREARNG